MPLFPSSSILIRLGLAAVLAAAGVARAAPVSFSYATTVESISGAFDGIAVGDAVRVVVVADNGSSGLLSQYWVEQDVLSATVTIGDRYAASFAAPYLNEVLFETDMFGGLLPPAFFDHDSQRLDSRGVTAGLSSNALRSGDAYAYFFDNAWAVSLEQPSGSVPEPSTLALVALAAGLMGVRRARRA